MVLNYKIREVVRSKEFLSKKEMETFISKMKMIHKNNFSIIEDIKQKEKTNNNCSNCFYGHPSDKKDNDGYILSKDYKGHIFMFRCKFYDYAQFEDFVCKNYKSK